MHKSKFLLASLFVVSVSAFAVQSPKFDAKLAEQRCSENGDLGACYSLGYLAERQRNLTEARKYYGKVCKAGSWDTCITLGKFEESLGDLAAASRWFNLACNDSAANGDGCVALASIASQIQQPEEAKRLRSKACNKGHQESCTTK